jgi:hypothetical protein
MSKYTRYYNRRKEFYRAFAVHWTAWAEGVELSSVEADGMNKFFRSIAKRFGLTQEFEKLGVFVQ